MCWGLAMVVKVLSCIWLCLLKHRRLLDQLPNIGPEKLMRPSFCHPLNLSYSLFMVTVINSSCLQKNRQSDSSHRFGLWTTCSSQWKLALDPCNKLLTRRQAYEHSVQSIAFYILQSLFSCGNFNLAWIHWQSVSINAVAKDNFFLQQRGKLCFEHFRFQCSRIWST